MAIWDDVIDEAEPDFFGPTEPAAEAFDSDPLRRRETVELVSAYYRIDDPALRRRLFDLARALAGGAERVSGN